MKALEQGFRLEELCIEPMTGAVSGPGGREQLDPKVMGVLARLAERAGEVVSREDLHERLWPNAVVTDDALTRCFYELRRQLSRAGGDEKYRDFIETLPKRGYRLSAVITPLAPKSEGEMPSRAMKRRWLAFGLPASLVILLAGAYFAYRIFGPVSAVPAPPMKSIAVLPFVDMSEGQNQQYIADGIAEEVLDRLAQNQGRLRVIARTSSFSFRNRSADIPEIARKLNVSHVLEGSVRRSGDRIRITVQLVEGAGASHLWSETYDKTLGELFAIQDEIASAVAAALQVALAGSSPGSSMPVSAESQDEYLQAKFFYGRRAPGDIERSIEYLEAAVARDPHFAQAWATLSGAYAQMWWSLGLDPSKWRAKQGEAARKAFAAGPELLDARLRLGQYYLDTSDSRRAIEHLGEAAKLDPDNPWLASFARGVIPWHDVGIEEVIDRHRKAVQDDPLSAIGRTNLGVALFAAGRLDEAKSEFRSAIELNPEVDWDVRLEVGRILVAQKRYGEAHTAFLRLHAEARDYGLALLHHAPGQRALADAALSRLRARSGDQMHAIRLAEALALRGMTDESFATLRDARDALPRDESIFTRLRFFQHELRMAPFLKSLRGDARWEALMARPAGDSAGEIIQGLWPTDQSASVRE